MLENENMSDIMKNLTNMLGEDKIPENLKEVFHNLNTSQSQSKSDSSSDSSISPEMLSNFVNMFQSSSNHDSQTNSTESSSPNIDIEMLMKMKSIMEKMNSNKNDPRSNLLLSLKPYLNENRQSKVEQYIKLFNIGKMIDVFNENGGDTHHA